MSAPHRDQNWSANRPNVRMTNAGSPEYPYSVGCYFSPEGIVSIMREPATGRPNAYNRKGYLRLETVHDGRVWCRTFHRTISDRGLYRLCRAFLADTRATPMRDAVRGDG